MTNLKDKVSNTKTKGILSLDIDQYKNALPEIPVDQFRSLLENEDALWTNSLEKHDQQMA